MEMEESQLLIPWLQTIAETDAEHKCLVYPRTYCLISNSRARRFYGELKRIIVALGQTIGYHGQENIQ
jgi:hypothetical protein